MRFCQKNATKPPYSANFFHHFSEVLLQLGADYGPKSGGINIDLMQKIRPLYIAL